MAKRFVVAFAATGDKTVTPDATDPAGAISYSQGWGSQYQLPDTDPSYRPVGRQEMNGVLNDVTGAIAELQQLGYPEWVAVAGLVTPYVINAWVRHAGVVYINTVANNSAVPGVGGSGWVDVAERFKGRLLATRLVTVNGTNTPTPGTLATRIRGVGGGGAGGGGPVTSATQYGAGAGGTAGSYAEGWFTSGFSGAAIVIGAAGVPGAAGNFPGGNGGNSTFGALMTCPGGAGGAGSPAFTAASAWTAPNSGTGTPATGGNLASVDGQAGGNGILLNISPLAGAGGSSPMGTGGNAPVAIGGRNATGFGAAGSGANATPSTFGRAGGAGTAGAFIVEDWA